MIITKQRRTSKRKSEHFFISESKQKKTGKRNEEANSEQRINKLSIFLIQSKTKTIEKKK